MAPRSAFSLALLWLLGIGGIVPSGADSLNVRLVGHLQGTFADLWVQGNKVYVTDWTGYNGQPAPMRILSIANPANPVQLSQFTNPSLVNDYDITVYGTCAYIANQNPSGPGMLIVDVSDSSNPVLAGTVTQTVEAHTNFVVGHYLLASNDVEIYDLLPDPTSPTFLVRLTTRDPNLGWAHEVSVLDTFLYVSAMDSPPRAGAFVYTFGNPAAPNFVGQASAVGCGQDAHSAWPAALSNRYVLVTDEINCGQLHIWDFANPSNPVRVNQFNWNNGIAHQIVTQGKYAYMAYYQGSPAGSGLLILDISNPANPTIAGFYNTPNAWGVDISAAPYICVSDMNGGLYVLRFTPQNAVEEDEVAEANPPSGPAGIRLQVQSPVRDRLGVRYFLSSPGEASLEMYDLSGRKVEIFPLEGKASRWQELSVPASLPAGVYFLRLRAGAQSALSKVVVMR